MGLLIEYYIPTKFVLHEAKGMPSAEGAKVIGFQIAVGVNADGQVVSSELRNSWIFVAPPR
jgi:hypothetical protein